MALIVKAWKLSLRTIINYKRNNELTYTVEFLLYWGILIFYVKDFINLNN
jgi:hypothetical protein